MEDHNSPHPGPQIDEVISWGLDNIANPITADSLGAALAKEQMLRHYSHLENIGINIGSETIESIFLAMPDFTVLRYEVGGAHAKIYPTQYGLVEFIKFNATRFFGRFWAKETTNEYRCSAKDESNTFTFYDWKKTLTTDGGTLSGNLSIQNPSGYSNLRLLSGDGAAGIIAERQPDNRLVLCCRPDIASSNGQVRYMFGSAEQSLDNLLRIVKNVDGTETTYPILHTGNIDKYIGTTRTIVGTYTGTGKNGSSNPCTIECGFAPKAALIFRLDGGAQGDDLFAFFVHGQKGVQFGSVPVSDEYGYTMLVNAMASTTWGTTNLKWYDTVASGSVNNGESQMNRSGATYGYIIWG